MLTNNQGEGKLEIHVPKEYSYERPPVTFSHNNLSTMAIKDHKLASMLPIPTNQISIQSNPYDLIDLGMRDDMPKTIGEMVGCDLPQLSLHIVSFQDATLVSLSWPHSVMGSLGIRHLLYAWSLVVAGKENEVPQFLGAKEDALLQIGGQDHEPKREELLIQPHRLTGLNMVTFLLRFVWNMRTPREVKSIFIPKRALEKLETGLKEEIEKTSPQGAAAASPDEATTILAWFVRLVALGSPASKPVTIINMFTATSAVASLLGQTGVYVQNILGYSFSFLSGDVARGELGPLVQEHARHVREQSTQEQSLSFIGMCRDAAQSGSPFKPFYGPSDAHPIVCNDIGALDIIRSVDFGAALLETLSAEKGAFAGKASCLYYHIVNNRLGAGTDCIYLLGKDHVENLWVTAALPADAWLRIEEALKAYE